MNIKPTDNLAALVEAAPAGETFQLAPGVYRPGELRLKDGQSLIGGADAHIIGAQITGGRFVFAGNTFSKAEHGHVW